MQAAHTSSPLPAYSRRPLHFICHRLYAILQSSLNHYFLHVHALLPLPSPPDKIGPALSSRTRNLSYSSDKELSTAKIRLPPACLSLNHRLVTNIRVQAPALKVLLWMKDAYMWFRLEFKALAKAAPTLAFISEVAEQFWNMSSSCPHLPPAGVVCKTVSVHLSYITCRGN